MEIKELYAEIERLKIENKKLRQILSDHGIEFDLPMSKQLSTLDKVKIYMNYFKGRTDVYAERYIKKDGTKGYAKVCENRFKREVCDYKKYPSCKKCPNYKCRIFDYSVCLEHLKGLKSYALYPIVENNKCYILGIDFDHDGYKTAAINFKKEAAALGIDSIIEISQSGTGAHVWIFFEDAILVKNARKLGDIILSSAIEKNPSISFQSYDRFFPSQDEVAENDFGSCIAMPLYGKVVPEGKGVFVDSGFIPYENQILSLSKVKKVAKIELDLFVRKYEHDEMKVEINPKLIKNLKLSHTDFPSNFNMVLMDDLYIDKKGLSSKSIAFIKRLSLVQNPQYYEKQRKRLSTYNVRRFIELFHEDENTISLPRGCIDDIKLILSYFDIPYTIIDKRCNHDTIDIQSSLTLRENQKAAVEELMKYNYGLLIAEMGSGKTYMGMEIISRIKKPTLILVDKERILNQWKERIHDNMTFNDGSQADVGVYYSAKKKLTGYIDVALIQSIYNTNDDIYDKYELIIGDEIHHIASRTYEEVIRRFTAKYIYGFTATPQRSDHLEKIIYKIISPIRYELEKKSQDFEKVLKPRFTKFKNKEEYALMSYPELCSELLQDPDRNLQIIKDILNEYEKGKNILVLTERKEHVDYISSQLATSCQQVISIYGSASSRKKKEFKEQLIQLSKGYIIVSTGKYLGEGFDLPSLDTLFLTMPFKWKGSLSQYIGRIQREFDDKKIVTVYDYVDIKVGKFARQFQLRLKEYKKNNYTVLDDNDKSGLLYLNNEYYLKMKEDILNSNHVKFLIQYADKNCLESLLELNDNITIISGLSFSHNLNLKIINKKIDINAIIINDEIIWYGSVNPFCYNKMDETILRINDREYVEEIMKEIKSKL